MKYFIGNQEYKGYTNSTIEECVAFCKSQKEIAIDIETTRKYKKGKYDETVYKGGLDPFLTRVIMLQIGTLEKRFIIDTRVIDISPLKEILESRNIVKVGANLMFESLHLKHSFGIELKGLYDVLIVDKLMTNGLYHSYSLESLRKRYRGHKTKSGVDLFGSNSLEKEIQTEIKKLEEHYILLGVFITDDLESSIREQAEEIVSERYVDKSIRLQFVDWGDKPFTEQQLSYGDEDITEPLELKKIFEKGRKVIKDYDRNNGFSYEIYYPEKAIRMENKLIEPLKDMILEGLCLDKDLWLKVAEEKLDIYNQKIQYLNDWLITSYPEFAGTLDLFTNKPICTIKWSSNKDIQNLFDKFGLCGEERSKFTGKVEKTVGAKALIKTLPNEYKTMFMDGVFPEDIEIGPKLVVYYLLLKKYQQLITTYGKDFLQYIHPITGRIHCNIRQNLNTGRMAATRPKLGLLINRAENRINCWKAA